MKNNTYFEELNQTARAFEEKHEAHKALKQQIIEEKGWDSEELKAWYAEEEQMSFPYSQGACKAYRAWRYSETDEVIMDDSTWDRERHDFIDTCGWESEELKTWYAKEEQMAFPSAADKLGFNTRHKSFTQIRQRTQQRV